MTVVAPILRDEKTGYTLAKLLDPIKDKSAAIATAVGNLEQLIGGVEDSSILRNARKDFGM